MRRRDWILAALVPAPDFDSVRVGLPAGDVVADRWRDGLDAPVAPGSLWKPFLAATSPHQSTLVCRGTVCWLGKRHGKLAVEGAIAQSCNEWFHQFLAPVGLDQINRGLAVFGLPEQSDRNWPEWRCTPRQLVLAYVELLARRADYPRVISGLRQAATRGTASVLGPLYLAKTGTGPSRRHAGDGWVMAAWPADAPRHLVIERRHGITGAAAAALLKTR